MSESENLAEYTLSARQRGINWSERDKVLAVQLITEKEAILYGQAKGKEATLLRKKTWKDITTAFNAKADEFRRQDQLKKCFENLRAAARKYLEDLHKVPIERRSRQSPPKPSIRIIVNCMGHNPNVNGYQRQISTEDVICKIEATDPSYSHEDIRHTDYTNPGNSQEDIRHTDYTDPGYSHEGIRRMDVTPLYLEGSNDNLNNNIGCNNDNGDHLDDNDGDDEADDFDDDSCRINGSITSTNHAQALGMDDFQSVDRLHRTRERKRKLEETYLQCEIERSKLQAEKLRLEVQHMSERRTEEKHLHELQMEVFAMKKQRLKNQSTQ